MWWFLLSLACRSASAPVVATPIASTAGETSVAASPAGDWVGTLQIGPARLRVVWHLVEADGAWSATLDSPDQGAFGIPVDEVAVDGGKVRLGVTAIGATFAGEVAGDRLDGTFTQRGVAAPLTLERLVGELAPAAKRPQDPEPPYPYEVEEVRVPSVPGVTLAGTYTRPRGEGPFPAVALITGSGPQDRDEALLGHRPFLVLADHLTRAGVAVLRTDDRGVGKSTGDFDAATSLDFAEDAAHALAWLAARPETGAVGWVGHSEGGVVGPLAQVRAADALPRADFLVLLAGPAVSGGDVLVEQGALIGAAEGAPAEVVEQNRALTAAVVARVVAGGPDVEADVRALFLASPGASELTSDQVDATVSELTSPWFRWFLAYDPAPTLRALDVPVLALFGELDLQVPPNQSAETMRALLGKRGTVEVLPGLNHLFQPAKTGAPSEYGSIETTMDPAALDRISVWILDVTR